MVVISRLSFVVMFSGILLAASGVFGNDQTVKRLDELLAGADADSPHSRLVKTVFGGMSDAELADLVVDSPSLSLRLRAAEELALHRGDRHPCETFLELLDGALEVPLPPRIEEAVRNGLLVPAGDRVLNEGALRLMMRGGSAIVEVKQPQWSATFQGTSSLAVKVGTRRHEVYAPFQRPTVAAAATDGGVVVCSLYEACGASPPLSVAFSSQTGEELWRRESPAPARHLFPPGMRQDLELVIHGDRVYLFGVCSLSMFIECFSLSDGSLIGSYRSRSAIKDEPPRLVRPAAKG
ncbi:hypothetical protein VT03_31470 [Planctomyces sp. SH-PL14]|nr:hypothetical protein VT03_31470 [Planctomyces sp. SH-PL14]